MKVILLVTRFRLRVCNDIYFLFRCGIQKLWKHDTFEKIYHLLLSGIIFDVKNANLSCLPLLLLWLLIIMCLLIMPIEIQIQNEAPGHGIIFGDILVYCLICSRCRGTIL